MGILDNLKEVGEFFNYKRRDSIVATKIIKKQLKQEKDREEYYKFKKAFFEKLDEILYSGDYSRVILKPYEDTDYMYDLISEDEEFNRFYEWRFTKGGEMEVRLKKLDITI